MRSRAATLRNILVAFSMLCAAALFGGAAKAASITYNGEPVFDIFDSEFIPVSVDETGDFSRIFRNMTGGIIDTIRMVFLPPLEQDPDVRGGTVLTADVNEVVYTALNFQVEQLFRIRLIGLVPESRFALASNNTTPLDPSEVARIFELFDGTPIGQDPIAGVPVPLPIFLLGSGLILLWGSRFRFGRRPA
ncbi:MAG: hypothetical protein AAGC86_13115 [Pseudomonadota bacterium]